MLHVSYQRTLTIAAFLTAAVLIAGIVAVTTTPLTAYADRDYKKDKDDKKDRHDKKDKKDKKDHDDGYDKDSSDVSKTINFPFLFFFFSNLAGLDAAAAGAANAFLLLL
jgi:hypothetical protein